jgi:hypothetical protein
MIFLKNSLLKGPDMTTIVRFFRKMPLQRFFQLPLCKNINFSLVSHSNVHTCKFLTALSFFFFFYTSIQNILTIRLIDTLIVMTV